MKDKIKDVYDKLKSEETNKKTKKLFVGPSSSDPSFEKMSVFKGPSVIFWIIFAMLAIAAYLQRENLYIGIIVMVVLFSMLMYKPRLLHFIEVQVFGVEGEEPPFLKIIKFIIIGLFIWIGFWTGSIFSLAIIILVFLVFELFAPLIRDGYLKLEDIAQRKREAVGLSGSGWGRKLLFSFLFQAAVTAFTFWMPAFNIVSRIVIGIVSGFFLGGFGLLAGISSLILLYLGFPYMYIPCFLIFGLISIFTKGSTRSLTPLERNVASSIANVGGRVFFVIFISLLLIFLPVAGWAYYEEGTIANLPAFIFVKGQETAEYIDVAELEAADIWNKTITGFQSWMAKQLKIATGGYYVSKVDKYSKGKLGVFIKKATSYEKKFYLDDTERKAIIGIDIQGGSLEMDDCENYPKENQLSIKKQERTEESGHRNLFEELTQSTNLNKNELKIIESVFKYWVSGEPVNLDLDLTDWDGKDEEQEPLSAPSGSPRTTYKSYTSGNYATYEQCIEQQTISLSCDIKHKEYEVIGDVDPPIVSMFDISGGGEGFECYLDKNGLNRDRNSDSVNIKASFPFSTRAYLKTYLMDEQKKHDLKRSNQDILRFYGITDKNPRPVYTSGPIMIGIETPQYLPLSVAVDDEKTTRMGITLENLWDGVIKKIYGLYIIVPKGINVRCNPPLIDNPVNLDDSFAYSMNSSYLKRDFNVEDVKTFYCRISPTYEVLDPTPITTKYIKVVAEYEYEISKKAYITYKKGDGLEGELYNCTDVCDDDDGCFCMANCKNVKADEGENCDAQTREELEKLREQDEIASQSSECGHVTNCNQYTLEDLCMRDVCQISGKCFPKYELISIGELFGHPAFNYCENCIGKSCSDYHEKICNQDPCDFGCGWEVDECIRTEGQDPDQYTVGGLSSYIFDSAICDRVDECFDYVDEGMASCSYDYCGLNCYPVYAGNTFTNCKSCSSFPVPNCNFYPNRVSCEKNLCRLTACEWEDGECQEKFTGLSSGSGSSGHSLLDYNLFCPKKYYTSSLRIENIKSYLPLLPKYYDYIKSAALAYNVPPSLIAGVITQESSFGKNIGDDGITGCKVGNQGDREEIICAARTLRNGYEGKIHDIYDDCLTKTTEPQRWICVLGHYNAGKIGNQAYASKVWRFNLEWNKYFCEQYFTQ